MRYGFSIAYYWEKGNVEACLMSLPIMWLFACFPGSRRSERSKRCRKNAARTGENDTSTKREGRVLRKETGFSSIHRFIRQICSGATRFFFVGAFFKLPHSSAKKVKVNK